MTEPRQSMLASPLLLSIFAGIVVTVVSYTYRITKPVIIEQQRQATLREINQLIKPTEYDNNIVNDTITLKTGMKLGQALPVLFYRARSGNKPVAAFFNVVAPDGYNGEILFLIGIYHNEQLAGLRIVSHRETPGLGDKIEQRKTHWLDQQFSHKSLQNPTAESWLVKRDGGAFDQFTGATVTPRAVVKATKKALLYFKAYKNKIFAIQNQDKTR